MIVLRGPGQAVGATLGDSLISRPRGMGESVGSISASIGTSVGAGFLTGGPIGAAIGLVTSAVSVFLHRAGPAQNVATTEIVNDAAPLLQQNLDAWNVSSKSAAEFAQCIQNFQAVWNQVCNSCAQPSLGNPGHSCLDDRLPAGVTFAFNTFNIVGNGMYDWFSYYLTPILTDPAAASYCITPPIVGIPGAPCYDPFCNAVVPLPACVPTQPAAQTNTASGGATDLSSIVSAATSAASGINWAAFLIPAALLLVIWMVNQ